MNFDFGMNHRSLRVFAWTGVALLLFVIFYGLFSLGMPAGALAFAMGITIILMAGLLCGWYVLRLWPHVQKSSPTAMFIVLPLVALLSFIGVAFFVNRMITQPYFLDFSLTILLLFLMSASFSALINLIRMRIKHQLHTAEVNVTHSKSELQVLQSQLSPHFLFNTLNNIYGLSLTEPQKVPQLLLKLSDLLRYSIYDTKEVFVPLQDELNYLNNYIVFEKVRLDDRLVLESNLDAFPDLIHIKIAPMLLIVFIENAFKHSKNNTAEKIYIEIKLQLEQDCIILQVKNSCSALVPTDSVSNKHSGFGLASVQKRLDILYRNNHSLEINRTKEFFTTILTLRTK